jgi:hypothetical protein
MNKSAARSATLRRWAATPANRKRPAAGWIVPIRDAMVVVGVYFGSIGIASVLQRQSAVLTMILRYAS